MKSPIVKMLMVCAVLILGVTATVAQPTFTRYSGNPVIAKGAAGEWDAGIVFLPSAVYYDSQFYLFYAGSAAFGSVPPSIGYAVSADGFAFAKSDSNPVFAADGSGFDAIHVTNPCILVEDSLWVLYYNARGSAGTGPGPAIGRATAPHPDGPWSRLDQPVLQTGSAGEWDSRFIGPCSVFPNDSGDGYFMYYHGGNAFPGGVWQIGMATSPDGITWTKYDDPRTTDPPYAESDPVFQPGIGDPLPWDANFVWMCTVLKTADDWEMFYSGGGAGSSIGYATSSDGVSWERHSLPVLTPPIGYSVVEGPGVVAVDNRYYMYHDLGTAVGRIDLATDSPPTSFHRLQPSDGDTLSGSPVNFAWRSAGDPDGNDIAYTLRITVAQVDTALVLTDTVATVDFGEFDLPNELLAVTWSVEANDGFLTTPAVNGAGQFILDLRPSGIANQGEGATATSYALRQNYPNPFNPATTIRYTTGARQLVSLKVYDLLGKEIATLVNEAQGAGEHTVQFDGSQLSSGIYFYKLAVGNASVGSRLFFTETRKMVLMK